MRLACAHVVSVYETRKGRGGGVTGQIASPSLEADISAASDPSPVDRFATSVLHTHTRTHTHTLTPIHRRALAETRRNARANK